MKNVVLSLVILVIALEFVSAFGAADGKPGPDLTPAEVRTLERLSDRAQDVGQQLSELEVRQKVLLEMRGKIGGDFQAFVTKVLEERGHKPGDGWVLDPQAKKILPPPPVAKPDPVGKEPPKK